MTTQETEAFKNAERVAITPFAEYKKGDRVVPSLHIHHGNYHWMIHSQFQNGNFATVKDKVNLGGIDYLYVRFDAGHKEYKQADEVASVI